MMSRQDEYRHKEMHIALGSSICYNASRQKDNSIHVVHKKDEPPEVR